MSALGPFEKEMLLRLDRIATALEQLATAANHGVIYTKCEITNALPVPVTIEPDEPHVDGT